MSNTTSTSVTIARRLITRRGAGCCVDGEIGGEKMRGRITVLSDCIYDCATVFAGARRLFSRFQETHWPSLLPIDPAPPHLSGALHPALVGLRYRHSVDTG